MKGISPKYLVMIGCAAGILLTLSIRSQILDRPAKKPDVYARPAQQANDPEITIHFHDRRPFYIKVGDKASGLVIDPIALSFTTAGVPFVWQETPARRQLDILRRNENQSCAAGWFKTAERETYARYTLPIYQDQPFVAITRADNEYIGETETLERVMKERRLQLLVKEAYSYGSFIDDRIKALAPRIITTTAENQSILKMIENYRADYSFMTKEEAEDLLLSPEVQASHFKLVRFSDMPPGGKRYIICSKQVAPEIIARLDAAIQSLNPVKEQE